MSHDAGQVLTQLHLDVARNSTDDFNLFHDSGKWNQIQNNPFQGPIMLGFQLESLIEGKINEFRKQRGEDKKIRELNLNFSNYQFNFVNPVKPGQEVSVEIKETLFIESPSPTISNRVLLRANGGIALIGHKRETTYPLFLADTTPDTPPNLRSLPDRSFLPDSPYFLKRKFMTTSNAKNFLCGSLRDQTQFFDEIRDVASFPELFPCALLSSALLEKALKYKHDFELYPMIYTSHKLSIDRACLSRLRSNDALHIFIKPNDLTAMYDFGENARTPLDYECYGLVNDNAVLFRALISLAPLESVIKAVT